MYFFNRANFNNNSLFYKFKVTIHTILLTAVYAEISREEARDICFSRSANDKHSDQTYAERASVDLFFLLFLGDQCWRWSKLCQNVQKLSFFSEIDRPHS